MPNINVTKLQMGTNCNFPGAEYNETKVAEGQADLVLMENIDASFQRRIEMLHQCGCNCKLDVEQYLKDHSIACNTQTRRWQFHVAVSVPGRELDKDELKDFAKHFMAEIGYGEQPYLVYFHHDTDNNHVHILSTRINEQGFAISDHQDIPFMNHCVNRLLHNDIQQDVRRMLGYTFLTMGQFANVIRSCGYQSMDLDKVGHDFIIYRNGTEAYRIPAANIRQLIMLNDDYRQQGRLKAEAKQLQAIFFKYRQESLKAKAEEWPKKKGHAKTKKELKAGKIKSFPDVKKLRHSDGTALSEDEQAQMVRFLTDMKVKLGVNICFQKDRNGVIRGYGIVDHRNRIALDGSKVMRLEDLIDFEAYCERLEQKRAERESKPRGYIPDAMLDGYRQLFKPRMVLIGEEEKTGIEITMADGEQHWQVISEAQLRWWQQAETEQERLDIAYRITVYAFHKEIYEAYRRQLEAKCQQRGKLPNGAGIREVRIYKMKNGNWQIAIYFTGQRDIDGLKATLSDEDAMTWMRQTDYGDKPNALLRMQLATKYTIAEDLRQIRAHHPYSAYRLSTTPVIATPPQIRQFLPLHRTAMATLRHILTCYGGAQDENREYEVGSQEGYEESIAREARMTM